ncbi:general odorant-binding protein 56d-like [Drosophila innubila]|uniref:general odorant-binding protein 56d-like n=1 Tax=Drosophila innubila TaxID=198719 RepID=UPI00148DB3BF|nr:general odorant-binding protein 56d-like [Drosophila innubila]
MKLLFVLLTYLAFASADDDLHLSPEEKTEGVNELIECHSKHNVTMEQITSNFVEIVEEADNTLKCFANCIFEKHGMIVDGQIQPDVVLKEFSPFFGADMVKSAQPVCNSIKGSDNCDTAFKVKNCYYKIAGKMLPSQILRFVNGTFTVLSKPIP